MFSAGVELQLPVFQWRYRPQKKLLYTFPRSDHEICIIVFPVGDRSTEESGRYPVQLDSVMVLSIKLMDGAGD